MICPLCSGSGEIAHASKKDVIRHMIENGAHYRDIAPVVGLSIGTISYHAKKMGIARGFREDEITNMEAKDVMAEKNLP